MGIDGKGNSLLTDGKLQGAPGLDTCIGIKHLDLSLIAEVNLCLVAHLLGHISRHTDTGCAHLEASLSLFGLVFILRADGAVNFRHSVYFLFFAIIILLCLGCHRK